MSTSGRPWVAKMKNVSKMVRLRKTGCCHRNRAPASNSRQAPGRVCGPGRRRIGGGTAGGGRKGVCPFLAARGHSAANHEHAHGRDREAGRVDRDGVSGAEHRRDQPREEGTGDGGRRLRRVEQAVGLGDPGRAGQRRDHGHVADLEDHPDRGAHRQDHVQEPDLRDGPPRPAGSARTRSSGPGRRRPSGSSGRAGRPGSRRRCPRRRPRPRPHPSAGPSARPSRSPAAPAAGRR